MYTAADLFLDERNDRDRDREREPREAEDIRGVSDDEFDDEMDDLDEEDADEDEGTL
jgi:hypothetical protein